MTVGQWGDIGRLGEGGVNGGGELLLRQLQTIFLVELIGLLKGSEL